ncbi:MAG: response regulator transcription factor [Deltaproteobacteria bacterium]|nr:response regulator transcription factor [Deltaproteobacteria bacterium]
MKTVHILIAEDDANIRNGLVDTLESEGYCAIPAADGEEALEIFQKGTYDLVILDIMMPGKNGFDVCRTIRIHNEDIPIIMLTAKGEEIDKVVGLKMGADDYITKPFGVHELLARIAAVLRRSQRRRETAGSSEQRPDCFTFGVAEIDTSQFRAKAGKKIYDLSAREIHLLQLFHAHPHAVLTRRQLLNTVWGIEYYGTTRTLDQHIAQLRKKIEPDPAHPTIIITVHGIGYRYDKKGMDGTPIKL